MFSIICILLPNLQIWCQRACYVKLDVRFDGALKIPKKSFFSTKKKNSFKNSTIFRHSTVKNFGTFHFLGNLICIFFFLFRITNFILKFCVLFLAFYPIFHQLYATYNSVTIIPLKPLLNPLPNAFSTNRKSHVLANKLLHFTYSLDNQTSTKTKNKKKNTHTFLS